ncbi:MAG: PQQ-binding-like beta-propeller repeat protein [Pirellulales bacterium]
MRSQCLSRGWLLPSALFVLLIHFSAAAAPAQGPAHRLRNWPHWRGPQFDGVAPFGDPPLHWDEQTNVRWKRELPGEGNSTPIVWEDLVFVLTAQDTGREGGAEELAALRLAAADQKTVPPGKFVDLQVLAVDRSTGATRWQVTAAQFLPREGLHPANTYASASPITDGQRLFVSFGSRGLFCYDLSGKLLWRRDSGPMRTRAGWGEGASPALWRNTLFVNCDQEAGSHLLALDAATGEQRWRVDRDEPTSWSTPLVVERPQGTQVITSATRRVRSYHAETGDVIWSCEGLTTNVISSPVADADAVYCMSSYGDSAVLAIPLDARGELTADQLRWTFTQAAPYGPSPLLADNRLYLTRGKASVVLSLDTQTGKPVWPLSRLPEAASDLFASPVAAAGRIYFLAADGTTAVLRLGDTFESLAVNRLDEQFEASPAIVGRQMFLRGRRHLYCLEEPPSQ